VTVKKKVYWTIAIIVVFGLGVLWLIGSIASNLEKEQTATQLRQIQSTQENLERLVAENINDETSLEDLKNENLVIYEKSDIFIKKESDKTALVNYGQEIYQILSLYLKPRENEVKIMIRALENQNPSEIGLITASRKTAEQALVSLIYLDTPEVLADIHLQLINNFNQLIFFLTNMENVLIKPKIALESAALYNPALIELWNTIIDLDNYLSDYDVVLKNKIEVDFTNYFND